MRSKQAELTSIMDNKRTAALEAGLRKSKAKKVVYSISKKVVDEGAKNPEKGKPYKAPAPKGSNRPRSPPIQKRATSPRVQPRGRATSPKPRATSPSSRPSSPVLRSGGRSPPHVHSARSGSNHRRMAAETPNASSGRRAAGRSLPPVHAARSGFHHRRTVPVDGSSKHSRRVERFEAQVDTPSVASEPSRGRSGGSQHRSSHGRSSKRYETQVDSREPVLLEDEDYSSEEATRESHDDSYTTEKHRYRRESRKDRREYDNMSASYSSGYLDYSDSGDGEIMNCGDGLVDEGFNCMSNYGGCHIVIVPSYDEGDNKDVWNTRERSRRSKSPTKTRRSKSRSRSGHWTDYFRG